VRAGGQIGRHVRYSRYFGFLLSARAQGPHYGSAKHSHELPPLHSITSSARSRIDCRVARPKAFDTAVGGADYQINRYKGFGNCCAAMGAEPRRQLWVRSGCRRDLPGAALARPVLLRYLVWGRFCQGGALRGLSIFFNVSFLVRPGQSVSSPRPTRNEWPARAEAVKDGA